ncbi:DUF4232 domain-containing protein [Streptomyces smyrnaeus]|uniref:DUF4232 domain-containing protein n=1 Tax=Streptomyces smyrnaeus TaxID=1387713 RepID=UPI00378BE77F
MTKRQDPTTTPQLSSTPQLPRISPHASAASASSASSASPASSTPQTSPPGARYAPSRRRRRVARVAAAATAVLAAGALVVGCSNESEPDPHKVSGEATPAGGEDSDGASKGGDGTSGSEAGSGEDGAAGGSEGSDSDGSGGSGSGGDDSSSSASSSSGGSGSGSASGSRCHTSDLKASFGRNHPGAGQKNFAVILTNRSDSTCTVRGYPGLAFVNSSGEQVSFDPNRTGGQVRTVKLSPGKSAWASLSYTNPEMTNVTTVTPSAAKITPPDERASLRVPWSGGPVTNTGKASVPKIGPLAPGTGG